MRFTRILLFLTIVLFFTFETKGQQLLRGKVTSDDGLEMLTDVNIQNLRSRDINTSDVGGNFKILVSYGDEILFTSSGYLSDSIYVDSTIDFNLLIVKLKPNVVALKSVTVDEMTKYKRDSLQRRLDYDNIYGKVHPAKVMNEKREGDDPGFSFSPLDYYSTKEVQKRKLERRLADNEENYFIDMKFSTSLVIHLTGLKGDSLYIFMNRFRPTYSYCRSSSRMDMIVYINDMFVLFKHH